MPEMQSNLAAELTKRYNALRGVGRPYLRERSSTGMIH
jgi:hypothetical protein